MGIAGVLLSTFIQSASAIWIKRINAKLPALQQISGGNHLLLFSLPSTFCPGIGWITDKSPPLFQIKAFTPSFTLEQLRRR